MEADVATSVHEEAAAQLSSAYRSGTPIAPLSTTFENFDTEDAYRVQQLQTEGWVRAGRSIVGRKVGLTSAAMRAQLGVDQPDYGVLLEDTEYPSGSTVAVDAFISPRVEPEIAFVLASALTGPGVTVDDAVAAIDHVRASLEIIDSRIADWRIGLVDTIADNASFGGFVLGDTVLLVGGLELADVACSLARNGVEVHSGVADAVLGSPINALVWLANTLGERGISLEAGQVVLPGSITAAVPVRAGDTFTAHFAGIGIVGITFE